MLFIALAAGVAATTILEKYLSTLRQQRDDLIFFRNDMQCRFILHRTLAQGYCNCKAPALSARIFESGRHMNCQPTPDYVTAGIASHEINSDDKK